MDTQVANAATLGKKVYEYYYGYTSLEQVLGSGAFQCIKCNCWRLKRGECFYAGMESLLKAARRV